MKRKPFSRRLATVAFVGGFLAAALIHGEASAQQELVQRTSPRLMQGIRPLGMGGGFIAVEGTDENTLFYNPAGIADFPKKFRWQFWLPAIAMPNVDFSYKAIPFFASDLPTLAQDIDKATTDSEKLDVFHNFTDKHTGQYEELGVRGNLVQVRHRHITGAVFFDNHTLLALINPSSSTFDIEAATHVGVQIGSAMEFLDERLQLGAAIKVVGRHLVDETITQREIIANDDFGDSLDFDNIGFGFGVDIGAKGRPPVPWKAWEFIDPVFALTINDLGHTRFTNAVGRIEQSLSGGIALHPGNNKWKFKSLLVADVRDLDRRTDFLTKLFTGYEFTWPDVSRHHKAFSARVGLSQGYLAGGVGLDFKRFKWNIASYGREIASRTHQKQSRMFGFQLTYGI